jgi:hypothetical protein
MMRSKGYRELERKVETFTRKQIERKRVAHVRLIGAIYVELLVLHAPTTKETNFF